ncbi:MAG: hypothetical protein EAZ35_05945 [Sphingobacteriia bacterium]|nr:MAG: hypothetical protein EAZ41_02575 [Sphingobacteriia bacterium]TAG30747.1 MAG: hypothetical protein EAZ35_05945 [Sphingobacteriia bacterium]
MNIISKLKQKKWITIFVIYLRYLIGGAMVFSSIVKIKGERFTSMDGIKEPINSAWHFFETLYQSGIYWKFIGWGQLIAGLLLMTQLYAALGAVMMFPIVINIFIITISYYFAFTPVITGLLLIANIFLLLWDYQKLLPLLQPNTVQKINAVLINREIEANKLWCYLGLLLFLITVIYIPLFERNPVYWFLICIVLGLTGLIIFNKQEKQFIKKN